MEVYVTCCFTNSECKLEYIAFNMVNKDKTEIIMFCKKKQKNPGGTWMVLILNSINVLETVFHFLIKIPNSQ